MSHLKVLNNLFNKYHSLEKKSNSINCHLNDLKSKNLIEVKEKEIFKCVNKKDKDYKLLRGEELNCSGNMYEQNGMLVCNTCSREGDISLKNPVSKKRIVADINYNKLENIIRKALDQIKQKDSKLENIKKVYGKSAWELIYNGIKLKVILIDNANNIFSLNLPIIDQNNIFLGFGSRYIIEGVVNGIELLNKNYSKLHKKIKSKIIENDDDKYNKIKQLSEVIDENISGKKDWSFFEQEFTPLFIKSLIKESGKLTDYFNFLRENTGNLKGSMIIKLGGASNPDLKVISKYEYYKTLIDSNMTWDPKCYIKKKITFEEVQKVWGQMSATFDINEAIIFALSNDITADAWTETEKINMNNQKKIKILPKNIIYEFIYYMEIEDEFIELIKNYKNCK